jgi:hypothetical protein
MNFVHNHPMAERSAKTVIKGWHTHHVAAGLLFATAAIGGIALVDRPVRADHQAQALFAQDFRYVAPRGFGDRGNSWAQAMAWWHNALYVGTSRETLCSSLFAIWQYVGYILDFKFASTYLPYPPPDPDLLCVDGPDLPIQAEIQRWDPKNPTQWTRVFQSALDLDNPGPGGGVPAPPGKKLPHDVAFRGFAAHTEPDGTEALYAFGVNGTMMWDRTKLPPPRILRSTDGINFKPIPQSPGTFLGNLAFNPDHSSYRSPVSFNGKLFVLSGPIFGQGALIGSADPAKGNDAWFLGSDPSILFYDMAVFNGWLYLGTLDLINGYSVMKTRAEGAPPYQLTTVIPPGAYLPDFPSKSVVSMEVFNGRLYVGTATFPELIAINPDDTWDLLMGAPRNVPAPGGGTKTKYPRSGLNAGFGQTLNDHVWQMDDRNGYLYLGTYNAATASRNSALGSLLADSMGTQVFGTTNGWYFTPVTLDGFANLGDPHGGKFDYGLRTMAQTPYGIFFGTTNDYYGLAILQGPAKRKSESDRGDDPEIRLHSHRPDDGGAFGNNGTNRAKHDLADFVRDDEPERAGGHGRQKVEHSGFSKFLRDPSDRFDIEPAGTSGAPLLSWRSSRADKKLPDRTFQVYRAPVNDILVRDNVNFEGWNGVNGNKIRDTYVGAYVKIAETPHHSYVDFSAQTGQRYMYYIVEDTAGVLSVPSNLAAFPLITPPVSFAQLLEELDAVYHRGRFSVVTGFQTLRANIVAAQTLAASCEIDSAVHLLRSQAVAAVILQPEATDIQVLIDKLVRRLLLHMQYPQFVVSSDFCAL